MKAKDIVDTALARAAARPVHRVDYDALNRLVKAQRAALTRAINSKDPSKVVLACKAAVEQWNQPGMMWPDDWSRWQRAIDDALPMHRRVALEDL